MTKNIYIDCYPCLLRQALDAVGFLDLDEVSTKKIIDETLLSLINMDDGLTSSEIAARIHHNIAREGEGKDPYLKAKQDSLEKAFELFDFAQHIIQISDDPLETALKLCTAGNIIDFGPSSDFDLRAAIEHVLNVHFTPFDYSAFKERLDHACHILFLADNAGETVFDRLLIEQIAKPLTYVVKKDAIMNDALYIDAQKTMLPEYVKIIDNGTAIQGTLLSHCSQEFMEEFQAADLIISKGMANFETLPYEGKRSFFLLKIKCKPIARLSGIPYESFVLKQAGLLFDREQGN